MTKTKTIVGSLATLSLAASLASAAAPPIVDAKDDGEILGIVMAISETEVHSAATAEEKKVSPVVMSFAQTVHQDHRKNLAETKDLAAKIGVTPRESPDVARIREKSAKELARLMQLSGASFEREFLSSMRDGHREALQMLDELLRTANNEELKKHLTATRQHVAMHLQTAENMKV